MTLDQSYYLKKRVNMKAYLLSQKMGKSSQETTAHKA